MRPLTCADILAYLLHHGWRWKFLGGDRPVLTNAPPGQTLCVGCGTWRDMASCETYGVCTRCHNAAAGQRWWRTA